MATCFRDILLTAMVDVNPTHGALLALFHQAIEKGPTMVTPCGVQVGGCLEHMGSRFLVCKEIADY